MIDQLCICMQIDKSVVPKYFHLGRPTLMKFLLIYRQIFNRNIFIKRLAFELTS